MEAGAVECANGHLFCAHCAKSTAFVDFGLRDLVLRSSLDEVLKWRGLACCVCGVRGSLRRSLVTEAAIAALPVRCGFTALGQVCRWIGRRDQFHAHDHVFSDSDQSQSHPPGRGTKRPNSALISGDSDNGDQRLKRSCHQRTSSVEENSENEVEFQIVASEIVPESAVPDISAAGEWISGSVAATEGQRIDGAEIFLDVGQSEDELYTISQADQATDGFRRVVVADVIEAGESEVCFVDVGETGGGHANDAGILHHAASTAGYDSDHEARELHVSHAGPQTVQQNVGAAAIPADDAAEIIPLVPDEDEFAQPVQKSPEDQRDTANAPTRTALASVNGADGPRVGELYIVPGEFHTVELALQNAGLIPKPTVSLIDQAARTIYDAIAGVVHRVSNTRAINAEEHTGD